jgi:hypothetical protein
MTKAGRAASVAPILVYGPPAVKHGEAGFVYYIL